MFERLWGGYYQGVDLVGGLGAGFDPGAAYYPQHPGGFYRPISGLGSGGRFTVESSPGGCLSVGEVGLG